MKKSVYFLLNGLLYFLMLSFTNGYAQNVGIGTTNPVARLHVVDSSVLFSGPATLPITPRLTPVSGAGIRLMWYPDKAAFRVGGVTGSSWDKDHIEYYSFASGFDSKASGLYSTALGYSTIASNHFALACGNSCVASGYASVALGNSTANGFNSTALGASTANGQYSTALGFSNARGSFSTALGISTTKAWGSLTVGHNNDTADNPDPNSPLPADRIFQIGNGSSYSALGNAMTVLRNGNTGLGTTNPLARLHVLDSSVLFTASQILPVAAGPPPVSGGGTRLMWYPDKAAFRVGGVFGPEWDKDSIGRYSFAGGYNSKASGASSFAIGFQPNASGPYAVAFGDNTRATGDNSTAFGFNTSAVGRYSTAFGISTYASGEYSTSFGLGTNASGLSALAAGLLSNASADYSTAIGESVVANSLNSISLGRHNDPILPSPTSSWVSTEPLLIIGNGTAPGPGRKNALVILKNGNTGIGTNSPLSTMHVSGGNSGSTPHPGSVLSVEGNVNTYINILTSANENGVLFGKPTNASMGGIIYNSIHPTDPNSLYFRVNDNTRMAIYNNGNAWLWGTLAQNSDARLKRNTLPIESSLKGLMQINGYRFQWKNETLDSSTQIGVLAQEVVKVYPELVKENAAGDLTVNYSGLVPILINAIKEQQQKIDELENRLLKLEKQNR